MLTVLVLFVVLIVIAVTFFARNKRYRWFYIIAKTYRRDIRGIIAMYKAKKWVNNYIKNQSTVASELAAIAKKYPNKVALRCDDHIWTYKEMMEIHHKVARFFSQEGYKKGDCIALLLENCSMYPCVWLGLSQIGVITALINTNLTNSSLIHSITKANAIGIIFGSNFAGSIKDIAGSLATIKLYEYQAQAKLSELLTNSFNLKQALDDISGAELGSEFVKGEYKDPLVYIYTSGTSGLPKATIMTNIRCLALARTSGIFMTTTKDYVTYFSLPLYHIAGAVYGITHVLILGGTCVIAKRFSATNFFSDCNKYNCNSAQYVGEMCRYLLALPEDFLVQHNATRFAGLGLRPQLWTNFVKRFNIKHVWEAYGSTEGVISLINTENVPGSIGYVPRYLKSLSPLRLVKCDEITGDPIRDANGFCIECDVDEPGLALGKINKSRISTTFEGYTDKRATIQKLLKDVFVSGDVYLNSGDILVYDEFGNYYMRDRIGDTYRWKGENISSIEVEGIINKVVGLADIAVFGVKIPETEGTAGMAVIDCSNKKVDYETLYSKLAPLLPNYAIPLFFRDTNGLQLTGTYKLIKKNLKVEGYDITQVKDPIYFYDSSVNKYVRLTNELYEQILSGKKRI